MSRKGLKSWIYLDRALIIEAHPRGLKRQKKKNLELEKTLEIKSEKNFLNFLNFSKIFKIAKQIQKAENISKKF